MRRFLLAWILLVSLALAGLTGLLVFGDFESLRRQAPVPPVFRPPIHEAVTGDMVRYERRVAEGTGWRGNGFLEYQVLRAVEYEGTNLGREFILRITESDAEGRERSRLMRIRPRSPVHGWLPPRFEEDETFPPGARPVVKTIRTATVPLLAGRSRPGFLVEAVIPRASLTETAERYWMTPEVAVFGVARWERDGEELVLLRSERQAP